MAEKTTRSVKCKVENIKDLVLENENCYKFYTTEQKVKIIKKYIEMEE